MPDSSAGSSSSGSERMARLARLGMLDFGKTTSIEIEMTEFEGHSREPPHSPTAGVLQTSEYAGSREGVQPRCCIECKPLHRSEPDSMSSIIAFQYLEERG